MMERSALISPDGTYRYRLTRTWDDSIDPVVWIMLNPSNADATIDDPTIRKCIGFSKLWGAGGIEVINLYALRTTYPPHLARADDPEGPNNAMVWETVLGGPVRRRVIAAWGQSMPTRLPPSKALHEWRLEQPNWLCLGRTKLKGAPRHPGRLAYTTGVEAW